MGRQIALLLVHGMGEQQPHGLTDSFVRNLTDRYAAGGRSVTTTHRIQPDENYGSPDSHVRMDIAGPRTDGTGADGIDRIDVHETYWADKPQGLIKLKEVGKWLVRTSLAPLRRWPQNASLFHKPDRGRGEAIRLFVREVLLAMLLPLLGTALLVFTLNAAGLTDGYVRSVRQELSDAALSGWAYLAGTGFSVAVVTGLFLLWGSIRIAGAVRYERGLTNSDTACDGRWAWLSQWSGGSSLVAVGLLAGAWQLYEHTDVAELVAIILRLDGEPFGRVVWFAIWLVVVLLIFVLLIKLLWELPWMGWKRGARVGGALAGLAGVIIVITVLVGAWQQPARLVLWGVLVGGTAVLSKFLVVNIGDVAIYLDGIDERSRHHKTREAILTAVAEKLTDLLKDDHHDEIFVVAHSLGSVISYDAINRLATGRRADVEGTGTSPLTAAQYDRLRGFYSFGSPLDKVVYFFHKTAKNGTPIRSQVQSSLTSFKRLTSGRPYGRYKFRQYTPQVPQDFRWRNAWSWGDALGHRLDFYDVDMGQRHFDYVPLIAHTSYWKDDAFYEDVRTFLDG